ncbi:MAG: putative O-glycosylation ligase, exosortase A system-associated [Nitrococcus sp.]|nr:putative O-glycosylation ligase, exosortase A system-associated [Nitrococcus sp.]
MAVPIGFFLPWFGVLAWTWIGLMNPHRLTWAIRDWPIAQWVAISTLLGLLLTQDRKRIPLSFETMLLGLLVVYFTITTIAAWSPAAAWPQWEKVMKIYLFTFVTTMLIFRRERIRLLMLVVVFSLGFYGVKGGVFSILTGGQYRVWGPPDSFIADNTALGLALCMNLPLALVAARQETNKWVRWALYTVFWLSIPAILFTYSRGAFLGLLAVLTPIMWRYKGRFLVLLLIGGLALYTAENLVPDKWVERQETTLNYEQDHSAMQRMQAWGVATNIALDRPLFGAGFNFVYGIDNSQWLSYANFVDEWAHVSRAAHSIYFEVLGEHGIIAFALFCALLFGTFWRLRRLAKQAYTAETAWIGGYARGVQLALIPYMTAGAFLSLAYFDLFYYLIALSAILHREHADATAAAVAKSDALLSATELEAQTPRAMPARSADYGSHRSCSPPYNPRLRD